MAHFVKTTWKSTADYPNLLHVYTSTSWSNQFLPRTWRHVFMKYAINKYVKSDWRSYDGTPIIIIFSTFFISGMMLFKQVDQSSDAITMWSRFTEALIWQIWIPRKLYHILLFSRNFFYEFLFLVLLKFLVHRQKILFF